MFYKEYVEVFVGDEKWQVIQVLQLDIYEWQVDFIYIQYLFFFEYIVEVLLVIVDVEQVWVLVVLGDLVIIDYIFFVGNIKVDSLVGCYLCEYGVELKDFNFYGFCCGNYEVMMCGIFVNICIKNEMFGGEEGGNILYVFSGEKLVIYDVVMCYQEDGILLVIVVGKEYGIGLLCDWVVKGINLLGVKVVIVESFECIYCFNLVGMGVLLLQFENGQDCKSLKLIGKEVLNICGFGGEFKLYMLFSVEVICEDGSQDSFKVFCCIDIFNEVEYFKVGGIFYYVLCSMF